MTHYIFSTSENCDSFIFSKMGKFHFVALFIVSFVFMFLTLFNGEILVMAAGTSDGSESWGYVEVRPSKILLYSFKLKFYSPCQYALSVKLSKISKKNCITTMHVIICLFVFDGVLTFMNTEAHMFWWYYKSPYRTKDPNNPWPIILWLQGGPVSTSTCLYVYAN